MFFFFIKVNSNLVQNYANFLYLYDVLSFLNYFKHKDNPAERKKIWRQITNKFKSQFVEYVEKCSEKLENEL